jgi:Acyl-CoA dehydrogenase, N-terminal domain
VGDKIAGGIRPEEFDVFHELIAIDEVARCGSGGILWGLFAGLSIGLPPLLHFASKEMQDRVCYLGIGLKGDYYCYNKKYL